MISWCGGRRSKDQYANLRDMSNFLRDPRDGKAKVTVPQRLTLASAALRSGCLALAPLGVFAFLSRNHPQFALSMAFCVAFLLPSAAIVVTLQRICKRELSWHTEGMLIGMLAPALAGLYLLVLRVSH